jgi:hypothetical protein
MKKKMRKFEDGGYTGDDEIVKYRMGMIDAQGNDLTKPKSRDFDTTDYETPSMDLPAAPVTKTVSQSKVSVTKPKSSWDDNSKIAPMPESPAENKARMEGLLKKQALERVEPENYVPGPGMLKGMLKSVVNKGLKTYTAKEIADMAPKMIGRESLKLGREPLKIGMKKGGAVKKMFSGGKVKSASSRADGCAIRGKTRA